MCLYMSIWKACSYEKVYEAFKTKSCNTKVYHRPIQVKANGCGTFGISISSVDDFTECCNWHDVVYGLSIYVYIYIEIYQMFVVL